MGNDAAFASLADLGEDVGDLLVPLSREPVHKQAERVVKLHNPGGYTGAFHCVPYMRMPMDLLASRQYQQIVFVSSAQCLKTVSLVQGTIGYNLTSTKSDMILVQTTQTVARDFGAGELARMFRASPELGEQIVKDNAHRKDFKAGNRLILGWPSVSVLSGKSVQYVLITDLDRMPTNVDGEGDVVGLSLNRIKAFMSRGKVIVESSPKGMSIPGSDEPESLHHFENSEGIVSHYHNGTMHRWYWPCMECGEYFQARPTFESRYLWIPDSKDLKEAAEASRLICPHCAALVDIHTHRPEMLERGDWVGLGQHIDKNGKLSGKIIDTNIASFALAGYASYLQKPKDLILRYLQAKHHAERTGEENILMEVTNTQLGAPFKSMLYGTRRNPHELEARSENSHERKKVPNEVLYLIAAVDIQQNRFVVQVHGYSVDEEYVIDRFSLRYSRRWNDELADNSPIRPAQYIEDWDEIKRYVIDAEYTRDDGAVMTPVVVGCDSGGQAGVTEKAFLYYRQLAQQNLSHRFALVKGAAHKDAARIKQSWPDKKKNTSKMDVAQGDVPVYMINTQIVKDSLFHDLDRTEKGSGYIHFPQGLTTAFYAELTREVKTDKGWQNLTGDPNEATDLFVYCRAIRIALGGDELNMANPPTWITLPANAVAPVDNAEKYKRYGEALNG